MMGKGRNKNFGSGINLLLLSIVFFIIIFIYFINQQFFKKDNGEAKFHLLQDSLLHPSTRAKLKFNSNTEILAEGEGLEIVKANCTGCHSAKLIIQNRATKEGWLNMIRWMQQTQNLWELGENEEIILKYLSTHYPPEEKGRRENLEDIEWYNLEP